MSIQVNAATGEIFIYDVIGSDWYGEGVTGMAIESALKDLGSMRAKIRINSPGGDADAGIAIYNALRRHKAGVDTYNDAVAASAASIIFLAGENRYASTGSRVMIHRAMTFAMGNRNDLMKTASVLEKYDDSMADIYAEYLGENKESILALMDDETWYSVDEAVAAGLATARAEGTGKKPKKAAWMTKAPEAFFDRDTPRYSKAQAALHRLRSMS